MPTPIDLNAVTLDDDERQPVETWTRVMGYHRPISSFNAGKRSEFAERRAYREAPAAAQAPAEAAE